MRQHGKRQNRDDVVTANEIVAAEKTQPPRRDITSRLDILLIYINPVYLLCAFLALSRPMVPGPAATSAGIVPEVGGRASRPNHALTCVLATLVLRGLGRRPDVHRSG
jgi:hypothetical protein